MMKAVLLHDEVFVFAGAGISRASGLPVFGSIRDGALRSLGLKSFVTDPGDGETPSRDRELAWALTPEPFLFALQRAGVDVKNWLHDLLGGGEPSVVHAVLQQHVARGGPAWTVNYDELIERASTEPTRLVAWPGPPDPDGENALHKPHGTLGGPLIATSEEVLQPLSREWLKALRAVTSGRTVVFVGYSGLDFDFHPHWNVVLSGAREVVWFDFDDAAAESRKRRMLPDVARQGKLVFPQADPAVPGSSNPSVKFLLWWRRNQLAEVTDTQIDSTLHEAPPRPVELKSAPPGTAGAILSVLSDVAGARRVYLRDLPRAPVPVLKQVVLLQLNHGGRGTARLLHLAASAPRVGRLAEVSSLARRKETTILANLGMHQLVLDRTANMRADDVSTVAINRASSMKMIGNLDDAAAIAAAAYTKARGERHAVRTANAAFQWAQSWLWAYRLDDAHSVVDEHLEPIAKVASGRWLAWHSYLRACLTINLGGSAGSAALDSAGQELQLASDRFMVEGLLDGYVSVRIAEIVRRQAMRDYEQALDLVEGVRNGSHPIGTYYTARHPYNQTIVDLVEAELRRATGKLEAAHALYSRSFASPYPFLSTNGALGLAVLAQGYDEASAARYAEAAAGKARAIAARYFIALAEQVLIGNEVSEIVWV